MCAAECNKIVTQRCKSNLARKCFMSKHCISASLVFVYIWVILKPSYTFGTEKTIKVHRFTNNLQGLKKVMVKDFSWNIIPWNALLFEKTLKQYQFSISRITDLFQTHVIHSGTCGNKGGVSRYFLPTRWPIEPKFSQVCYFIYKS